jgi:hypothetical protein
MEKEVATQKKQKKNNKQGLPTKHGKVTCLTDGKVFQSAYSAAEYYKISPSAIYKCVTHAMISTHGMQFMSENGGAPRSKKPKPKKVLVHDLQDMRFGKLTVISRAGTTEAGKTKWRCKCDCGQETVAQTAHLVDGRRVSCGCLKMDRTWLRKPAKLQVSKNLLRNYKKGAASRGYDFLLSIEEFNALIFGPCFYCGNNGYGHQTISHRCNNETIETVIAHNGIDRMNNNLGYISANCVSCCEICNRAKMRMEFKDFVEYLDRMTAYRVQLGR